MARTTAGVSMIDPLPGSPDAKARLAAILSTIAGDISIEEACAQTGLGQARFFDLRKELLTGALGLLEKRSAGRKPADSSSAEIEKLREENERLRLQVQAAHLRAEVGLVLPHVLREPPAPAASGKKRRRR